MNSETNAKPPRPWLAPSLLVLFLVLAAGVMAVPNLGKPFPEGTAAFGWTAVAFGATSALFFVASLMVRREKFKTRFRLRVVCAVGGTVAAGAVILLLERWGYCGADGVCQYPVPM